MSDNISRFPFSSWTRHPPEKGEALSPADLAALRADFLSRWTAALPNARAAVAAETQAIIARAKEGR